MNSSHSKHHSSTRPVRHHKHRFTSHRKPQPSLTTPPETHSTVFFGNQGSDQTITSPAKSYSPSVKALPTETSVFKPISRDPLSAIIVDCTSPLQQTEISVLGSISRDPPSAIFKNCTHPLQPAHLRPKDKGKPLPTNKFYGNLMIGDSHAPIWTHPYGLRWDSNGPAQQGLAISHIDDHSKTFGPPFRLEPEADGLGSSGFYMNPFLVSMGLSATELNSTHEMTIGDFGEFDCTMILTPGNTTEIGLDGPTSYLRVPIVRGMAMVSAVYKNLTPRIFSNVLIRNLIMDALPRTDRWVKYRFMIEDGVTWLLYARADSDSDQPLRLEKQINRDVVAMSGKFTGLIQIAKIPAGNETEAEILYDAAAGIYAIAGRLVVQDKCNQSHSDAGEYRIDWVVEGDLTKQFMHFTLPHHRAILTNSSRETSLVLPSTTKGKMVAYLGQSWHLLEPNRMHVGFLPDRWQDRVSQQQWEEIRKQAYHDVKDDFGKATDMDSLYFAGKRLAKFGLLCLVVADVLGDDELLSQECVDKLKDAFLRFLENRQRFPLVYDTTWKGLITSQGLVGGAEADFGSAWYNDHHYHYGYFVHTAALIRHLDPSWRTEALSSFVSGLLRDVANPSSEDPYFPVFRNFDWFMGHSWSQGLFSSLDGKDEESTSEDVNFYYAMSLWAMVSNEPQLEQLGQVMMTIARRSIQSYFLMEHNNANHPSEFIGNRVTGILFENKVDHTTYFSRRIECIQGIQMIPVTPALPLIRCKEFVRQEWDELLSSRVEQIEDGWKSVLMMNYAALDKSAVWEYLTAENSTSMPLDDGLSKTWALFYVASLDP
ncbi:hypothetical protein BGX28_001703 [Mortierella sp. GBA30]|nr:hypothetical protein BGX28_001703 [Mortierella sp. GBA30]